MPFACRYNGWVRDITARLELRGLILDGYDTYFPATAILEIRTGAPAGAENAAGGSLLASITLPATPWAAAASGSKAKQGTWQVAASGTGIAGHYRLKNAGDTRREEGTATATGGGGDMTLDNTNIAAAQVVTVTTFTRTL
jgi:hypothetical protein